MWGTVNDVLFQVSRFRTYTVLEYLGYIQVSWFARFTVGCIRCRMYGVESLCRDFWAWAKKGLV